MPPIRIGVVFRCAGAISLGLACACNGDAQTVWSGLDFSFTKADSTDPLLEENQDRITDNVWITRTNGEGLINAVSECDGVFGCDYTHNFSPEDTRWATLWLNPGGTIAASNHAQLNFSDWEDAYDNRVGQLMLDPQYRDAVVHLITDDIYLDLQFTSWSQRCCGGFSYLRAIAPSGMEPNGDYNGNGIVDAADYVVWRKTLNEPAVPQGSGADGDADGTIDPDDYDFWVTRFGDIVPGTGGGSHAATAPEPTAIVHLAIGLFALQWLSSRGENAKNKPRGGSDASV